MMKGTRPEKIIYWPRQTMWARFYLKSPFPTLPYGTSEISRFVAFGAIKKKTILTTAQLQEQQKQWPEPLPDELYTYFELEKWQICQLSCKKPDIRTYPYISLWGLEQALIHQNEDCLLLPSYDWIRAWQELYKLDPGLTVEVVGVSADASLAIEIHFEWNKKRHICKEVEGQLVVEVDGQVVAFEKFLSSEGLGDYFGL